MCHFGRTNRLLRALLSSKLGPGGTIFMSTSWCGRTRDGSFCPVGPSYFISSFLFKEGERGNYSPIKQ